MDKKKLILAKIKPIFQKVFNKKNIKLNYKSSSSNIKNWDSLAQITLVLNIERMFKIKFKITEISALNNVGEMINLIITKKK
tara:strand:- start:1603 stop:1848 length:246 start_codon:yes stop_codon:yes gene_type:complete